MTASHRGRSMPPSFTSERPPASGSGERRDSVIPRMGATAGEVVVPFAAPRHLLRTVSTVRSTLIVSALAQLRKGGHFEAYESAVSPVHRDELLNAVAGMWLPIETVVAHYAACDSLTLPPEEIYQRGYAVGKAIRGTMLGTAAYLATQTGVTPWTMLSHASRLWARGFEGGAVAIYKTGPKEARVEIAAFCLALSANWRDAFRGVCTSMLELFCQRAFIHELRGHQSSSGCAFRVQWA